MRELLAELRRGADEDRPILLGVLILWSLLLALLASQGINGLRISAYLANLSLYFAVLAFFIAFWIGIKLASHRPDRPIAFLAASFVSERLHLRLMRGAPMLLALVIFLPAFSAMKSAIPLFNEYAWDDTWIALDSAIHGTDPWRLLQPAFGYPIITSAISAFYHLWILLIYAGGAYFCFLQDNRELRARYFIAYFGCWAILGVATATAFASVGPCFLGPLLDDQRFAEQMAYLRSADEEFPIMVLFVQDQLVAWHQSGNHGLGRGITAMPSMHVSVAFLFFLAVRQVSRRAGMFFGAFCLIVMIGSVHLAYHYAVDGYVSIAATLLIWMAAGAWARRMTGRGRDRAEPAEALPA